MSGCAALVLAGGSGVRLGGDVPKQYLPLAGRSVLRHSVDAFVAHPAIDAVRCVIRPADRALYESAVAGLTILDAVAGGDDRQESARRGLESLRDRAPAAVLIHDGARPFVDAATIDRTLAALESHAGALPAVPLSDTLKRSAGELVTETVSRDGLWRAQTPQGFRYAEILKAHRSLAGESLTDDAAVAERAGLDVALVKGNESNMKITTADDLERARRLLVGATEIRTGTGYDVHRFGAGDQVMLCGVAVPHDRGLEGHSDSDVGLHAVTDAILGAVAAGDIGMHFPPSDEQWRDAASEAFLRHAHGLARAKGGEVSNIDVTIICEKPRIGPHRDAMRRRIAEILEIDEERVSVKATTTDGLGFTGRGEGIAAQAAVTVRLPGP